MLSNIRKSLKKNKDCVPMSEYKNLASNALRNGSSKGGKVMRSFRKK